MELEQYRILAECLQLCNKLLEKMEYDNDTISSCMSGDLRRVYLEANELAINQVLSVRNRLNEIAQ